MYNATISRKQNNVVLKVTDRPVRPRVSTLQCAKMFLMLLCHTPVTIIKTTYLLTYRTPDFVNGPFVALGDSFDLAPADPFLNFSFPSYGNFREGDPPTQQKVLPHLTVRALTDSNSPSARSTLALRARALRARAG